MALTKAKIINEALLLLNDVGLEYISLRQLAARLHVKAPTLYWHFKSKTELIDHMAEAMVAREFADLKPCEADQPWQDWLENTMRHLRRTLLAYKNGGQVVIHAHLRTATTLTKVSDMCIESLMNSGMSLMDAHIISMTTIHYTYAHVIREEVIATPEEGAFITSAAYKKSLSHEGGRW